MPRQPSRSPAPSAWFFWLVVQLLALLISAARFPLSARFPKDGEQFSLAVMLVTQILLLAMLCPLLMRDLRATLTTIAIAWPMAALAAFLSDTPLARAALAETYVSIWAISMMLWIKTLRGESPKLLAATAATLLAISGPLLWYLHAEFVNEAPDIFWPHLAPVGPIMGALSQLAPDRPAWNAWWFLAAVLITGGIGALARRIKRNHLPRA